MYIPSQSDDMSSRLTMTSEDQSETKADRLSQPESSVKKRKRLYEAQDSPQSGPLDVLTANHLYHTSLPTPAASTSSFLSEILSSRPLLSPTRTLSLANGFPSKKRVQLGVTSGARADSRPVPARSYSDPHIGIPRPNLHACHMCNRGPKVLQDLPGFADCESCQQRTCYVCMRICDGPRCQLLNPPRVPSTPSAIMSTDGRHVCRKCCLEIGAEGRVWCLVCYEDDADPEDYSTGRTKEVMQLERAERVTDWLQECDEDDDH
ncbi:hypothetical protein MMC15_000748 [Xylographa vitiligo]|nr:hypothetical protein [Xylographa vitiligo]